MRHLLDPPSYGYERNGEFYVPTTAEMLREFRIRMNPFHDRRNWISAFNWLIAAALVVPVVFFVSQYFSWKGLLIALFYGIWLNIFGTVYLHRFGAHRAFKTKNKFSLFVFRNLGVKLVVEELFTVSHLVHHAQPEKPGDPYNAHGGWLYCFLADVNHQSIARDLTPENYARIAELLRHQGVRSNCYLSYKKWGSISQPFFTLLQFASNWIFWGSVSFFLGGWPLVCAVFSGCFLWSISIRNFNYKSHGSGQDRRKIGREFHWEDLSLNRSFAGFSSGEWHNNHHLFPQSARAGFLPFQLDISWLCVALAWRLGLITDVRDDRENFLSKRGPNAQSA